MKKCYIYFWLDTRKKGPYTYHSRNRKLSFNYEPFYVGISNNEKRPYWDKRNKFFNRVLKKILDRGLKPKVIVKEIKGSWKLVKLYERYFIKLIGRRNLGTGPLTNLTDGGDGNLGWLPSKKTRKNMSEASSGKNNGFYGKHHTEERNKGIRKKLKGRLRSKQHCKNLSKALKGKKQSAEHIEKRTAKLRGVTHSEERRLIGAKAQKKRYKENPMSEETKEKLRIINTGKVMLEETKDKISKKLKNVPKPKGFGAKVSKALKGRTKSPEEIKNGSRIFKLTKDNKSIYKLNLRKFCRERGFSYSTLMIIRGREIHSGPAKGWSCERYRGKVIELISKKDKEFYFPIEDWDKIKSLFSDKGISFNNWKGSIIHKPYEH